MKTNIHMKTKFTLIAMVFSLAVCAQNGGRYQENNSVRLRFAGFEKTWVVNKQGCPAIIRVRHGSVTSTHSVGAKDSIRVHTPLVGKVAAKTETHCGATDFGWVELDLTLDILPIRLNSLTTTPMGNRVLKVEFEPLEATEVKEFTVEVSEDGITWRPVRIILPDALRPQRRYTAIIDFKKEKL
jgi:hypothetical protein